MSGSTPPRIGAVLDGKYRIERLLGRGGMGAVYEGTQLELSRRVAIKVLEQEVADATAFAATAREARAAAQLAHPHIVQVTDFGAAPGEPPFLVMELLQGESLADRLARVGRLGADEAVFVAIQVLSALAAAHDAGLVHRDVKPANVYLARTAATHDFVKLLDFGIAWNMGPTVSTRGSPAAGTPAFMAPEQVIGGTIDVRTDIWAVGVCLFEMLSGQRPFTATKMNELLVRIAAEAPLSLRAVAPGVSAELERIVQRALEKAPDARFQSAEEMRAALAPLARATAVPSKALVKSSGPPDTLREAFAPTAIDVGSTASIPSRGSETERLPVPRAAEHVTTDTLASNVPPTLTSAAPGPLPPVSRKRHAIIGAAAAVGLAALGVAAVLGRHAPPAPSEARAAEAPACRVVRQLEPWSVDGWVDLGSIGADVLLVADVRVGPPRFGVAAGDDPRLSPWADPRFVAVTDSGARALGCAGGSRGSVAAGAVVENARGSTFSLMPVRPPPAYPAGQPMPFDASALPHRSRRLRCAHSDDATLFASVGDDRPMPDDPVALPGMLRLVLEGDGAHPNWVGMVSGLLDYDVAMSSDLVAVGLAREVGLYIGTSTPNALGLSLLSVDAGPAERPSLAIAQDRIHLAWRPQGSTALHWASVDAKGSQHVHGQIAAADVVVRPALAARGERLVLAWARRAGDQVEILVGSGPTLSDAADHAAVVARAAAVERLLLAMGDAPWLSWVAPDPGGGKSAHVAALACP